MRKDQFGHEMNDHYIFVPIKVAGVTHKNGRRSRQTILRRIYWKDEPYQKLDGIDFVPVFFENEPAVEVWVFNKKAREMIGYVPKTEASFVHSHFSDYEGFFDFDVYGGGKREDGTSVSYGASVTLRFINKSVSLAIDSDSASSPKQDPVPKLDPVLERAERALSSSKPSSSAFQPDHRPVSPVVQRSVDLFRTLYPDIKISSYHQLRGEGNYVGIHTLQNGQETRFIVQYDPKEDALDCYDIKMNPLSSTRLKPSKRKKGHPFVWLCALAALVLFALYFLR